MIKQKLKMFLITLAASGLISVIMPLASFAQEGEGGYVESGSDSDKYYSDNENGGVNSRNWGLILHGSLGYGENTYGVMSGSFSDTLGSGKGSGFDFGAMFNFGIYAFNLNYGQASLGNLKLTQNIAGTDHEYETSGDGNFSTLDILAGVKLFTEKGDMGYTHFYGGFRYWEVTRNVDYLKLDGVQQADSDYRHEQAGSGWIIGYNDLSTFAFAHSGIALALYTAFLIDYAPVRSFRVDGTELDYDVTFALGTGFDFGIGLAMENMGLLVLIGSKTEFLATEFSYSGSNYISGAGSALAYILVAVEF